MSALLQSVADATRSLFARGMPKLVLYCMLTTFALLSLFAYGTVRGMDALLVSYFPQSADSVPSFWLWVASPLIVLGLFPLMLPVIVSFFDEEIAERTEKHFYPRLVIGRSPPVWPEIAADMRFTLKAILINLLCLPLHFIPFFYYFLNAYLLGTQFFMMAGGRHIGKAAARELAARHRGTVMMAGLLILVAAQIPFVNLVAPLWGVALMVHLYQRIQPPAQILTPEPSVVTIEAVP